MAAILVPKQIFRELNLFYAIKNLVTERCIRADHLSLTPILATDFISLRCCQIHAP